MTPIERPGGHPEQADLAIDVNADNLYAMRSAVSAHATDWGMVESRVDRLLVIATELATNAIRHGGGAGRLRLRRTDASVTCEVTDEGPGMPGADTVGLAQVPLEADHGRGLWIVRQYADSVWIATSRHGTTVTATLSMTV